ncbi:MAG: hypothetical protein KDA84_16570, partial [Planctomycetaceae bacterium]|nr:hypothetical protein [Planctomycetaceae bacterium]
MSNFDWEVACHWLRQCDFGLMLEKSTGKASGTRQTKIVVAPVRRNATEGVACWGLSCSTLWAD